MVQCCMTNNIQHSTFEELVRRDAVVHASVRVKNAIDTIRLILSESPQHLMSVEEKVALVEARLCLVEVSQRIRDAMSEQLMAVHTDR